MSTATALQLVNRVQRLLRGEDLSSVSSGEGAILLDLVNDAANTILGERTWDFQARNVGLTFFEAQTLTNQTVTNSLSSFSPSGSIIAWSYPYLGRMVVTSDATYGSQSFKLTQQTDAVPTFSLDTVFYGASSSTATVLWFCYEYILAPTIRAVLSLRHENRELRLLGVAPSAFDEIFARPWDERDDDPAVAVVGGTAAGTIPLAGSATYGTVLRIWPVPSARMRLELSYVEMPTRLTATTSTFAGTPEHIEELIVYLAYARAQQTGVGSEPASGMALEARILGEMVRRWASHKPDHGTRAAIGPFDQARRGDSAYRGLPRLVGTL